MASRCRPATYTSLIPYRPFMLSRKFRPQANVASTRFACHPNFSENARAARASRASFRACTCPRSKSTTSACTSPPLCWPSPCPSPGMEPCGGPCGGYVMSGEGVLGSWVGVGATSSISCSSSPCAASSLPLGVEPWAETGAKPGRVIDTRKSCGEVGTESRAASADALRPGVNIWYQW